MRDVDGQQTFVFVLVFVFWFCTIADTDTIARSHRHRHTHTSTLVSADRAAGVAATKIRKESNWNSPFITNLSFAREGNAIKLLRAHFSQYITVALHVYVRTCVCGWAKKIALVRARSLAHSQSSPRAVSLSVDSHSNAIRFVDFSDSRTRGGRGTSRRRRSRGSDATVAVAAE